MLSEIGERARTKKMSHFIIPMSGSVVALILLCNQRKTKSGCIVSENTARYGVYLLFFQAFYFKWSEWANSLIRWKSLIEPGAFNLTRKLNELSLRTRVSCLSYNNWKWFMIDVKENALIQCKNVIKYQSFFGGSKVRSSRYLSFTSGAL